MRNATRIKRIRAKDKGYDKKVRQYDGFHFSDSGTREVYIIGDVVIDKKGKQKLERVSLTSESRSS